MTQKVAACKTILRISLLEAATREESSSAEIAVCKGQVIEVLKGPPAEEVTFRLHAYDAFSPGYLPKMLKKEYVVFLHELKAPHRKTNELWVFEGPAGMRSIATNYQEYRISTAGSFVIETLSHSNFISAIRAFAAPPHGKKN